nr:autotransporter domain-containing protein [Bradyrhizobium sp. JYMT SZCCT0180]
MDAGARVYTFKPSYLFLTGTGVINNSSNAPNFAPVSALGFQNGATASNANIVTTASAGTFNYVEFRNTSTADHATITQSGATYFFDTATASNATINTSVLFVGNGGFTYFQDSSTAANATLNNNNGARTLFVHSSTAADAHINNIGALGNPANIPTTTSFVDTSTAGNATIANTDGGRTEFYNTTTASTAKITNGGQDTTTGFQGSASFQNNSSAGNATIINNQFGGTGFSDSATAANASITNNSGGVTSFLTTSTAGNATITNNNGGQTVFADNSTAGNARLINGAGGSISFVGTGLLGDNKVTAASIEGAGIFFLMTANLTVGSNNLSTEVSGVIQGGGSLTKVGSGTLTLSGNNGLSGITTISKGNVQIGNGGTTGSLAGNVIFSTPNPGDPQASLVFNRSDYSQYSGMISGSGKVVISGSGRTVLSGNNTYSGTTTVNAGTLDVQGGISSSSLVTVNANAALTGTGTIGDTVIANGGILAAGNSFAGSSMTVTSLALASGAQYMVRINPTTSSFANVTGTATLGGAAVNATFSNGAYVEKKYTILTASTLSGTFGSTINSNLPSGFKTALSYDATHAYLDLSLVFVPPPGSGLSGNQQNVGNAIINYFNRDGSIPLVFGGLTPTGLTQISGETAAGSQHTTFNAMNQFVGVMTDPFIAGRGDPISGGGGPNAYVEEEPLAYAARGRSRSKSERDAYAAIYTKAPPVRTFEQRWSVWAAGFGGSQTTDGSTVVGSNDTRSSIYGVAAGADYRLSPNALAGFALAGGGTNFSVNGFGSGRSDLFQAGAFIRHNVGAAYLSGALAYGWQDITTDRTVTVAGVDRLRAQFNANAWSGRVEGGYRFVTNGFGLTPYAAGQFTTFELPAYAEQAIVGANTFALAYGARSVTNTRSELGLRSDKSFAMQDGILTLRGRAAWAHDFNPDRSIGATFQTLPGASFVVNGARQAADAALVTGSAEMKWLNGLSLAATFEGEFSSVTRSYAGKGVARYSW